MFKRIAEFGKERKARKKSEEIVRDGEGRAVMEIAVRDDDAFLAPYSRGASETISEETAEFLRDSALGIPPEEELTLRLRSDCIDERERKIYPEAIKSYFSSHLSDARRELRINAVQAAVTFLVGVVALAFMILAERLGWGQIWTECIDIFAWVFLWESVDVFFLERAALRRRRRRCLAFLGMKVEFLPLEPSAASSEEPEPAETVR